MKKTLFAIAVLLLFTANAHADGKRSHDFTGVANDTSVRLIGSGISYNKVTWNKINTVTVCVGKLQKSVDNVVWTDYIAVADCSVNGASAVDNTVVNYVRMITTSFTGTGTVTMAWNGFVADPVPTGGTITGTISASHLVYASGADAAADVANSAVTGATGATVLTQAGNTTKQLSLVGTGNFNNTVPILDVSNSATVAAAGNVSIRGDGDGTTFSLLDLASDDDNSLLLTMRNNTKSANPANNASFTMSNAGALTLGNINGPIMLVNGSGDITLVPNSGLTTSPRFQSTVATGTSPFVAASTTLVTNLNANFLNGSGFTNIPAIGTATNCADSAGAAACGSAAAGAFVVDAAATTTVVSTTAVTANSEILVMYDSSLGTRLGITCNTTAALPAVTAGTAATSFTVTVPVAPITNPACYNYLVIN